jgi:hypothetical protein
MAAAAEIADINTILEYIGFAVPIQRTSIAEDAFESFADLLSLTEKDVGSLAKGFAERTQQQGRIIFGLRRTNLLKATIHWAQDFRRISRGVTLDGIADAAAFKIAIETAKQRAQIRKHNAEESSSLSKAADPGKLKRQKEWTAWSRGFKNYLSTILGQDGVPLSHIIRENEEPDYSLEAEEDYDYEQLTINCAPLTGLVFKADATKVHQLIHGFVQGETSETWIKPSERRKNGRIDYLALLAHYGGEGNKSVRIQEAEVLRKNLVYKSERTMSFEKFLTNMQAMFTGFQENEEEQTEAQKIRLLFDKVQSPSLETTKGALKVRYDIDVAGGAVITYDFIANSLAAKAASLPDYVAHRNASGVETQGSQGSAPASGVKGPDGKIFTAYYPNWNSMSDEDKTTVIEERKRLGTTPKGKSKHRRAKTSAVKTKAKALAKLTRKVAALQTKFSGLKKRDSEDNDDDDDEADEPQDNAGNQFGGRKSKKKKKKD